MPLDERNGNRTACTVLIVTNRDDIRAGLRQQVEQLGHEITVVNERDEALTFEDRNQFDLLVSDLVGDASGADFVRSFKLAVTSRPGRRSVPAVHNIIERMLSFKLRC